MVKRMIHIIGAGPAGSYAAYLLAKRGFAVHVYEEHAQIGKPIQCTGIVTSDVYRFLHKKRLAASGAIINAVTRANVYAPDGSFVPITFAKPNLILDREIFDVHIANRALEAGATYHMNHRLTRIFTKNGRTHVLFDTLDGKLHLRLRSYDVLIGADGPLSIIRSYLNKNEPVLYKRKSLVTGIQSRVQMNNTNCVLYHPYAKDYAWFVPESTEIGRIGIVGKEVTIERFQAFTSHIGQTMHKTPKHIEYISGTIPVFTKQLKFSRQTKTQQIYLLGDAAGFIKETTGGGIIPSFLGARALASSILHKTPYVRELQKTLFPKLAMHKLIAKTLRNLTVSEWNALIADLNRPNVRHILERKTRDNIVGLAFSLLLKRPSLLKYAFAIFR